MSATDLNSNQMENEETIDEPEPIPKVTIASGSGLNNPSEIPMKKKKTNTSIESPGTK